MTASSDRVTSTLVLDSLRDPLFVVGPDGTVVYVNEQLSEITTCPPAELEDSALTELATFIEAGFDDLREGIDTVLRDGVTERRVDVSFVSPEETATNGRARREARLTRLTDDDGLVGVLVIVRDTVGREETAQRPGPGMNDRRFRAMFEAHSAPMLLIDPQSGRITEANTAAADFYGYSRETLTEMTIQQINCLSPAEVAAERRRAQAENRNHFEFEHKLASGEVRPVEVHSSPVEINGRELLFSVVHDITERERREREFEQIFNGVNDSITIHDPETAEMQEVNDTFCELVGYDRERLLNMEIGEFSRTDLGYTTEQGRAFIRSVGTTGEPKQTEWAVETADGETKWVEVHGTIADIGGQRRFIAIDRDITEAKRREREYEQIFNGVNDSIVVHDPVSGEMVDANDTFCELVGYSRETVLELGTVGLSVTEEGYTEERAMEIIETVDRDGSLEPFEWKVETAEGTHRLLEVTATQAEIGGRTRHLSLMRDITEQRRREREFEQIFDSVNDLINVYDPETKELVEVNETTCSVLGYDREEILARDVEGVSATGLGYTRDRVEAVIDRVMNGDEPVEGIEWALRTASGEVRWIEVNATPAVINGQRRFLAIARDVTGRKNREERAQVLNRVLRHNLRNDMDTVKAYAEALADACDEHRTYSKRIETIADELVRLGNKAREIEEILTGEGPRAVDRLSNVIEASTTDIEERFPSAEVTVDLCGTDIQVNSSVLRSVLRELLENGIKHNDADDPRVELRTQPVERDDAIALQVLDNGPGIPEGELATLRRGEEDALDHGRGLGLWLVKWGMKRIDGHIEFRDDPQNTVVTLYLDDARP